MDPQILSGPGYDVYLRRLDRCKSANVDVLEIYQFEDEEPTVKSASLDNVQLQNWLEKPDCHFCFGSKSGWLGQSSEIPTNQQGKKALGALRLILGPSTQHILPEDLPAAFPHGMKDILNLKTLPFSRQILEKIIEKFNLPAVTPWVLATRSSHFQRHSIRCSQSPAFIGYTMRRTTRGILALNISLSLSHDPSTGMTSGLLLGCSDIQQAFIYEQIRTLATLASHPLLLPVLFSAHQHQLLNRERKKLWVSLLKVETESGQTGAPVIGSHMFQKKSKDYGRITKNVLGVIQIASAWESYSKALILGIDTIQENLVYLSDMTTDSRKTAVKATATILTEWLISVRHKSNVMLWDFEFIDKRAQAQMTAVHSYIAQRDAQLSQKLSEYSTVLAADSREIAAASKRDSSAMKGIAFLTMVFLPGTYIATFFAMPLLDFSTPTPTSKPGFWIYWAVTAPLTISVLTIYLTYLTRVSRKNRAEDKKVRKDVSTSQGTHLPCASIETNYSDKHHGLFSMLSDAMPESLFGKSSTRVQPNPELGLSGKVEMAQLPGGKKLENSSGITRSGDFQTLPTSGPSGCYIDYDVVETVGVLPHMENVAEGTQYYPPPEPSSSRLRPGRSPSITIDTTYAGWGSSNARANLDSDWDSSSSFGL